MAWNCRCLVVDVALQWGIMRQAATSIVLILGQLASIAAAPFYVCTSADGRQKLEWGECTCNDKQSHFQALLDEPQLDSASPCERHLGQSPCHCEHQPLTDELRSISRIESDLRAALTAVLAESGAQQHHSLAGKVLAVSLPSPQGHTVLVDLHSICLRC